MGCSIIENVNTLASGNFSLEACAASGHEAAKAADVVPPPRTLSPLVTAAEPNLELEMDLDLNYPSPVDESSTGSLPPALVDELIANTVAELLLGST